MVELLLWKELSCLFNPTTWLPIFTHNIDTCSHVLKHCSDNARERAHCHTEYAMSVFGNIHVIDLSVDKKKS